MSGTEGRSIELRRLVDSLPGLVSVLERAGDEVVLRAANEQVAELAGRPLGEVLDRPIGEFQPEAVVRAACELVDDALAAGHPIRSELDITLQQGRRTFDVTLIPLTDVAGQVLTVTHDLTRMREIQAALDETQAIARIGHWSWDMEADEITWTDELFRIMGLEPDAFEANYEAYRRMLHPDDREAVEAAVQAAIADRSGYTHQHRIVRPDGEVRVISSLGHVVTGEHGEPIRLAGTAQDVTERIEAQEEAIRLREAQSRHEQGLELNDNVMQGLAVARLALVEGDVEAAMDALDRTMEAARDIIRSLLEARVHAHGGLHPGDLVRSRGALELEDA